MSSVYDLWIAIYICTYTYAYVYMHTHKYIYTCICMHIYTHMYIYIHMHIYIYACVHIHIYTCVYIHTQQIQIGIYGKFKTLKLNKCIKNWCFCSPAQYLSQILSELLIKSTGYQCCLYKKERFSIDLDIHLEKNFRITYLTPFIIHMEV